MTRRVEQPLARLRVWDAGVRRGAGLLEQWKARARAAAQALRPPCCAAALLRQCKAVSAG